MIQKKKKVELWETLQEGRKAACKYTEWPKDPALAAQSGTQNAGECQAQGRWERMDNLNAESENMGNS